MRWTEEQLADFQAGKTGVSAPPPAIVQAVADAPFAVPDGQASRYALGRLPTGTLNKTEQKYADHLEQQRRVDAIAWFRFEGVKLRLADNTFYTCDFAVMAADGTLEMHEVKGFWTDDARVKIKVAASIYPFRFVAVKAKAKKHGGGWGVEEF